MSTMLRYAFSVTRFSFWIGALLSSLIGSLLYVATMRSIEREAQERFMSHARYAQGVVSVRIKSYTDLLRGTASMLHSSERISHRAFHDYVQGLELGKNYPAVDTLNFAAYVTDAERGGLERSLGDELRAMYPGLAQFTILPPGVRPDYLVVAYIEPDAPNVTHYGADLQTNPFLQGQLAHARDTDTLHSTARPIPLLSSRNDIHLGLRVPVYRHGTALATVDERRAGYLGSLGIAFSVPKLLQGVLDEMPVVGVRMTLFDVGSDAAPPGTSGRPMRQVLFDSRGSANDPTPPLAGGKNVFSTTLPLDFNGRRWQMTYSVPKARMYSEFDVAFPKLMMAFGFLGSILLYALLHMLTSSREAALALAREMTSELRESQNKLQLSHHKLRRLADHAYQIKEQERKRIAREIHDDLGQSLLALRIETEMLATRTEGTHNYLHKRARATLLQIDATIKSVRQIINDLRPTVLDLGLSAAVEWQVAQFQRRTGIECVLHDDHGEISLPDHCATAFFRILQESLTNVVRHARASKVSVELCLAGGWLSLTVVDNGCGLPPGGRGEHDSFGLVGIEERIVILGGTCTIFSEAGNGTTVIVSAPVTSLPENGLSVLRELESGSSVI
jgi:signal transduction histidine kinase